MGAADAPERRRGRINDDRGKETPAARGGQSGAPAGGKKSRPVRSPNARRRALRKDGAGSQESVARQSKASQVRPQGRRSAYFLEVWADVAFSVAASFRMSTWPLEWNEPPVAVLASCRGSAGRK